MVQEAGLSPRKGLGQHFLFDGNLTDRIARAAFDVAAGDAGLAGRTLLEIGPGPGGLTRSLLAAGANVVAIEADRRAVAALAPLAAVAGERLTLVEGDALALDHAGLAGDGAIICANLPYNVATPLLVGWLNATPWPAFWSHATVMVQREVAERIVAAPATPAYGRLAVLTAVRARATRLFDVPPEAFVPPPKVWSTVVRLEPLAARCADLDALQAVTAAAFGQRRKMLRSSLKGLVRDPQALLGAADIDPTQRAERLTVQDFVRLTELLPRFR